MTKDELGCFTYVRDPLTGCSTFTNVLTESRFATKLANVLNDSCQELEHLDIPALNMVSFELFIP